MSEMVDKFDVFRIAYTECLIPKDTKKVFGKEVIENNKELITDLQVIIQYKLYLLNGDTELFFPTNEAYGENIGKGVNYYSEKDKPSIAVLEDIKIRDFVKCYIKDKKIDVRIDRKKIEMLGFRLGYKIYKYAKSVMYSTRENDIHRHIRAMEITEKEFTDILNQNYKYFKKYEKEPTQTIESRFYKKEED